MKKIFKNILISTALLLSSLGCFAGPNVLLEGDSWLGGQFNKFASEQIDGYLGIPTLKVALNSELSTHLLWHLNYLYNTGLNLGDGAVMVIDVGLPDFLATPPIPRSLTLSNLENVVSLNAAHGIYTIISGAPNVTSGTQLTDGTPLVIDPIYAQVKASHPEWVQIIDVQSVLMQIEPLRLSTDNAVHLNDNGYALFNLVLANKVREAIGLGAVYHAQSDVFAWLASAGLNAHDACIAAKLVEMSYGCNT